MSCHGRTGFAVRPIKCLGGSFGGWNQDPRLREPCLAGGGGRNSGLLC